MGFLLKYILREASIIRRMFTTQEMLEGDLPAKALTLAKEWVKKYKTELLNIWNTQKIRKLPPLE
jgi:hypothetical protein